ncbi:NAD(P)/FAD-dependent oxidoreductase [Metabacillus herbersteinensis]|uniref:NAD(P)/FAD-dependent oxidoreductase n=1 Tax=Metabacillus herbersteinensis TaxID=283816 RepID=A0ABV6GFT4_9BACI
MGKVYECIVIGAGIAGLQAAIQLGRYQHEVLIIDSEAGRSTLCRNYHNLLGWPDGVSGQTLRDLGKKQAESYGVPFVTDKVENAITDKNIFLLKTTNGQTYQAKRVLLATGISDRIPEIPNLKPCLGLTIFVCPDCDGYEVKNKKVLVLGAGSAGASLALTLTYWTKDITYINHEAEDIEDKLQKKLSKKGIKYVREKINEVLTEKESSFKGVLLESGQTIKADRAFIAFGGNKVHSELAKQLGVERLENKHLLVDPRTKETNVPNVWAAGDIVAHSEQVSIAMGDGCQAAIWIHKSIMSGNE